jgi:hypothetical protein
MTRVLIFKAPDAFVVMEVDAPCRTHRQGGQSGALGGLTCQVNRVRFMPGSRVKWWW